MAVGPKVWAPLAAKLGSYFAEAKIGGDLTGGGNTFGMTKEAAQARLQELTGDREFSKRYFDLDPSAVREVKRLHRIVAGS
jgi:hypothetical protein